MFRYNIIFISIFLLLASYLILVDSYVPPTPTFEILNPKGIRISIADEPDLQFFAFQGNINKDIELNEIGRISNEVYKKDNGKWTIQNQNINLVEGNVIHYWIYVQVNKVMYNKKGTWTVIVSQLVFNETFNSFNESINWEREVKIPLSPDYEFCIYHNEQHPTVSVKNGILKIKPMLLEKEYGENASLYGTLQLSGCTSKIPAECMRKATSFNILPPIISARLISSFHFRYGKIEIRAKFPEGDWLYPEMWLKPKYGYYGSDYSSGCVNLGLARGNNNLINNADGSIYDSRRLDFGILIGRDTNVTNYNTFPQILENGWTKDFHTYTTIWDLEGFQFFVDNKKVDKLVPPTDSWMYRNDLNKMAPFDQEFCIVIGVGVGGNRVFPDKTTSSKHAKPWKNVDAKLLWKFWHAKDQWLPSWNENTAFEIDYIRVWSF